MEFRENENNMVANLNIKVKWKLNLNYMYYSKKAFFTKEEIQSVCDKIVNAQDKFIVYALFNNMMSAVTNKEFMSIKVKDIPEDLSYIDIKGIRFILDDYMKNLVKNCIEEKEFLYGRMWTDLDVDSKYLIKKSARQVKNGDKPLTTQAINRKLEKMTYKTFGRKYLFSRTNLSVSGIIYQMNLKEKNESIDWNEDKVNEFLILNGIQCDASIIYNCYQIKYHDRDYA